jgi:hypothetical protein
METNIPACIGKMMSLENIWGKRPSHGRTPGSFSSILLTWWA